MSKNTFALLEGTQSDDVKDILKNVSTTDKKQDNAPVEEKKGGQKQNRKPNASRPASSQQQRGNNRRPQSSNAVATPTDDSADFEENQDSRSHRGGKRGSGYAPPRRGFAYDRSISRNNRGGRGFKKGGAGGHNWGKAGDDNFVAPQEQAETPATPTTPAAEGETQPKETEQQAPAPAVEEEKDDTVSFAEYQKKQKEALSKLGLDTLKAKQRAAGENIAVDPKALAFKNEVKKETAEIKIKSAEQAKPAPAAATTEKPAEKDSKKAKKLDLGELLKDVPTRPVSSERRGGSRGGRGSFRGSRGGRGGRGRGNAGARVPPPPSLNDSNLFPALK